MWIVKNNNNKIKHILAINILYSNQDFLNIDDNYFIGAIRKKYI